jgi:ribosomal protein S18 acetylase RimI-like enzyme
MTNATQDRFSVHRASSEEFEKAWDIIEEYYKAAAVIARDEKDELFRAYFQSGAGVWLAAFESQVVGCVALRPLSQIEESAEIKRLYVRPPFRGQGIADALYRELETFATDSGYKWLYLDTASGMIAAQKFYQSLGFESCNRYNSNPQAAIFMRKELRSN